jgi:hypothetical protein
VGGVPNASAARGAACAIKKNSLAFCPNDCLNFNLPFEPILVLEAPGRE